MQKKHKKHEKRDEIKLSALYDGSRQTREESQNKRETRKIVESHRVKRNDIVLLFTPATAYCTKKLRMTRMAHIHHKPRRVKHKPPITARSGNNVADPPRAPPPPTSSQRRVCTLHLPSASQTLASASKCTYDE